MAQSYTHLEIIIVDDASDPEHLPDLVLIASLDPRIRLLRQERATGASAARNKAIFAAKGEFITGLDDDDQFEPHRIDLFVNHWSLLSRASFLCSGYQVHTKTMSFSYATKSREISWHDLLFANHIGNQLFTKTSYLQTVQGFDDAMPSCQDYDAWLRLAERFGSGYRIADLSYIVHQEHDAPRISEGRHKEQGYQLLLEKHGRFMSKAQRKSQQFYRTLYTQPWSAIELLCLTDRRTVVVAAKNIVLRWVTLFKGVLHRYVR